MEESKLLTAILEPETATDTLSWSSSNTAVAIVADGVVTAVAPGNAIVTASTSDRRYKSSSVITVSGTTDSGGSGGGGGCIGINFTGLALILLPLFSLRKKR